GPSLRRADPACRGPGVGVAPGPVGQRLLLLDPGPGNHRVHRLAAARGGRGALGSARDLARPGQVPAHEKGAPQGALSAAAAWRVSRATAAWPAAAGTRCRARPG